jgi:integrase
VKYVNRIRQPDGREFLYLRKKGLPSVRLPEGLDEAGLARHIADLIADLSPDPDLPAGTLREALRRYELESPEFRGLADSTKYEYRLILKEFEDDIGRLATSAFTPGLVDRLKTAWAKRGHRAANIRLQILRNVLKPALVGGALDKDPFPVVGQVRRPRELKEPHLIWSEAVFEAVVTAAVAAEKAGLARAVCIARFVGPRRGDLVRIPRTARQDGRFQYLSGKRRVRVDVPEDPHLAAWLTRIPDAPSSKPRRGRKAEPDAPPVVPTTLVFNVLGRPYSEDGLALELRKLVTAQHRAGRIDSDRYDLHGLRHTRGVELALAGCSDAEGAAMLGHGSPSSFAQYRRQADRIRLADAAAARVAALREKAGNGKCKTGRQESAKSGPGTKKDRRFSPVLSRACDGTAHPDRTGDLQSHNLAL